MFYRQQNKSSKHQYLILLNWPLKLVLQPDPHSLFAPKLQQTDKNDTSVNRKAMWQQWKILDESRCIASIEQLLLTLQLP